MKFEFTEDEYNYIVKKAMLNEELAQERGTLLDKRNFVRWYLDSNFKRIDNPPYKVYQVAEIFKNNVVLCTIKGHIFCVKYGIIYDTFNPSDRVVEDVWIVK